MCLVGLRLPGRCVPRAVAWVCMELRDESRARDGMLPLHARNSCVGEGSQGARKAIVVIMKFARKQQKHIYPLPVAYTLIPFSFLYLPTYPFPAAFRIADNQTKSERRTLRGT
jgi:hypothetical protein